MPAAAAKLYETSKLWSLADSNNDAIALHELVKQYIFFLWLDNFARHRSKAHAYMPYLLNRDNKQFCYMNTNIHQNLALLLPMMLNHSCDANQHWIGFSVIICPVWTGCSKNSKWQAPWNNGSSPLALCLLTELKQQETVEDWHSIPTQRNGLISKFALLAQGPPYFLISITEPVILRVKWVIWWTGSWIM